MKRDDGSDERGEVESEGGVVGLDVKSGNDFGGRQIWQQIEHLLQRIEQSLVGRNFALCLQKTLIRKKKRERECRLLTTNSRYCSISRSFAASARSEETLSRTCVVSEETDVS